MKRATDRDSKHDEYLGEKQMDGVHSANCDWKCPRESEQRRQKEGGEAAVICDMRT